jgi:DnaJ-class molecular chaperone
MATKGRKLGVKNGQGQPNSKDCFYCEGTGRHFIGDNCQACDGTGSELVRRQLQKVYNSKNNLPLNYNLKPD